ncbi:MAG: PAS domain-containing protein [Anaerolineae bacterium]|nr:PAS domain-containing protein [Anaerolineae bacterium]
MRNWHLSPQWQVMLGYEVGELAQSYTSWQERVHGDDLAIVQAEMARHLAGETAVYTCEYRMRCKDGSYKWVRARGQVIEHSADGQVSRMIGTQVDITERRQTEEMILNVAHGVSAATGSYFFRSLVAYLGKSLQADMAFVGELVDNEHIQTIAVYLDGKIVPDFNYELAPSPCQNVVGRRICIYPERVQELFPNDQALVEKCIEGYIGAPLFSSDKKALGIMVVLFRQPISNARIAQSMLQIFAARAAAELERMRAEEALRRSEAQLRQVQKMEAIGRLAGGIAHDFNNILTVIISYSEMLMRTHSPVNDTVYRQARQINEAGERAARLTQQLLAYSRRQVLTPIVLNLNTAVTHMIEMLRHLVGDHIVLITELSAELWLSKADPSQLEQVIMNLILNARDAMPEGGSITIRTRNVQLAAADLAENEQTWQRGRSRRYVLLSVTDTGLGMDEKTQAQIFEPFFSTKGRDKGTGLGLATVQGIITQSGGFIRVQSSPGKGATFEVFLPHENGIDLSIPEEGEPQSAGGGSELILLVEDEDNVRELVATILRNYGYQVVAADSLEALDACQGLQGQIDLLLTDVIMPGVSGPELAAMLTQQCRKLRVLYMSGYTDDIMLLHGIEKKMSLFAKTVYTAESG